MSNVISAPWSDVIEIPDRYARNDAACIPDTYRRAVSVKQLEEFADLVEAVLETYEYYNSHTNELVTKENVTLYDINVLFIKPLTVETKEKEACSFVEIVAAKDCEAQDATWFVSHWWGTPFFDTLRMLKLHAKERNVHPETEFYWICAFANCQHNLDELEDTHYMSTPFAKAIMNPTTVGSIVLLTEKTAMPFQRSWCVFESFVALTHGVEEKEIPHKMDFATIIPRWDCETQLTVDQWDSLKELMDEEQFNSVYQYKPMFYNQRCTGILCEQNRSSESKVPTYKDVVDHPFRSVSTLAWFPTAVSQKGMLVNIADAEASMDSDREHISSWVADREDEVNRTMHRVFSPFGLYCAATQMGDLENLKRTVRSVEDLFGTKEIVIAVAHQQDVVFDVAKYTDAWGPILVYLLDYGCDPNFKCQREEGRGQTPLDSAFYSGNYSHVRTLLKYNADLSLVDRKNIWKDYCPADIVQLLDENGM